MALLFSFFLLKFKFNNIKFMYDCEYEFNFFALCVIISIYGYLFNK